MEGKRYTTEDKIRILGEADRGERTIQVICREANISEVTFHRWKRQFGEMEVNQARQLKELERESGGARLRVEGSGRRSKHYQEPTSFRPFASCGQRSHGKTHASLQHPPNDDCQGSLKVQNQGQ
jgi:putative transposase